MTREDTLLKRYIFSVTFFLITKKIKIQIIVIYDVRVKSEILFCKWGRLGNERSELTNPTNKIKSLLTRPSYIYFLYNWFALH
jgi:hypothetical protein